MRYFEKISTLEKFEYNSIEEIVSRVYSHFPDVDIEFIEVLKDLQFPCETAYEMSHILLALRSEFHNKINKIHKYTARIPLNSGNRTGFTIEFRHPLILNDDGLVGRKVRKGLGSDKERATYILNEVNELLRNPLYWTGEGSIKAGERFSSESLHIFYMGTNIDKLEDKMKKL